MKILVDHQIFLLQKYGGISNYHFNINRAINSFGSGDRSTILALGSANEYIHAKLNVLKPLNKRGRGLLKGINRYALGTIISRYDVFHPSFYDNSFLALKKLPPFVLTIHDMIPEKFFSDSPNQILIKNKQDLLNRAARVIAVSETTKREMMQFYKIDPDTIDVVTHGCPDYFDEYIVKDNQISSDKEQPYVLFVGRREKYKNFNFFLESISSFLIKHKFLLKVVGAPASGEELQLIATLNIAANVVFHSYASDEELFNYYRMAFCFAFPSLDEGFGIPLLEASVAKCPIVCSDIPVFREVCGDSALYFDPLSKDSMLESLESLLSATTLRTELIQKAQKNAAGFSWLEAGRKTLEVYKKAVANN